MDAFQASLAHRTVYDTSATTSHKVVNTHPTTGCGGYTDSAMQKALLAVEQGGTSIRVATKRFKVAHSTIMYQVKLKKGHHMDLQLISQRLKKKSLLAFSYAVQILAIWPHSATNFSIGAKHH